MIAISACGKSTAYLHGHRYTIGNGSGFECGLLLVFSLAQIELSQIEFDVIGFRDC
jgi:hypothetical protein